MRTLIRRAARRHGKNGVEVGREEGRKRGGTCFFCFAGMIEADEGRERSVARSDEGGEAIEGGRKRCDDVSQAYARVDQREQAS